MQRIKDTFLLRWQKLDKSWCFSITAFLAAWLFYTLWSWTIFTVQPLAVQNVDLFGEPVLTIFDLENSERYTYLRDLGGERLIFRAEGSKHVADLRTGSIWEVATGTAVAGRYQGSTLAPAETTPERIFPYHGTRPYPHTWLALWQRFDANWYVSIAETGYGGVKGDDHFPPLFPMLIRLLMPIFGSAFLAGLFISHLATLYAIKLLHQTFSEWAGNSLANRTTLFFLVYPTSFFLFSVYSESVFLVTALLSLQQMRRQRWTWAGFWTFCAVLTRLQGAALLIPLLYLMWRDRPFLRKPDHWFGLAVPGLGGMFYLFLRSSQVRDNAIPFVEPEWHARLVPPWETYAYAMQTLLSGRFTFVDFLNWVVVTLFLVLLIAGRRKIPLEYNLYTAFSLLIMLIRIVDAQPLISMSRYTLTLFPSFFVLGMAGENPWMRRLILYTCILLNLYLSAQFFFWGWVA